MLTHTKFGKPYPSSLTLSPVSLSLCFSHPAHPTWTPTPSFPTWSLVPTLLPACDPSSSLPPGLIREPLNDYPLEKGNPPLSSTEDEMVGWHHRLQDMSLSKIREMVKDRKAWHAAVHGVAKSWTRLRHWTTATTCPLSWLKVSKTEEEFSNQNASSSKYWGQTDKCQALS